MVELVWIDDGVGLADLVAVEGEVDEIVDFVVYGKDEGLGSVDRLEMDLVIRGGEAGETDEKFGDTLTAVYRFGGGERFATPI